MRHSSFANCLTIEFLSVAAASTNVGSSGPLTSDNQMSYGFKPSRRFGIHFDLAVEVGKTLERCNLKKKGSVEREFEQAIVSTLEGSPKLAEGLITQVGDDPVDKVTSADIFGFKHRPDSAIGIDGTAIEIKVVSRGFSIRDLIGQAFAYRVQYRFVVLVLVDNTPGNQVAKLCNDPNSNEYKMLSDLADKLNIFSIIGPLDKRSNATFIAEPQADAGLNAAA